ncbi:hypothetical protein CH249_14090 [Rhodococcus sp. 05-2255-3B1]|uniref:hypothetical protein n=1 Tax=unclassified Rhodococcus (in: high G+C Gram-positive bacteria) TaxID=192944 RepID=UPI000B9BE0AA|nr:MULTISPECIES: hypothetical protein [unclassified Rhodococcus (in: high G+C Gram-positive bacteria)]OZE10210.1 hypothetical protein CH249_14090 [Rhodococcus sp. 05-2255-3B1]OZE13620.1 hypothetical protein CH250_07045 [Rhodococcus sp. 05-2255-3C]OZE13707.1 hypothetical protein CH255_23850 [Rhodococcus sp. 05-2255-2A2]
MASTEPLITVDHIRDASQESFPEDANSPELKQLQFLIRFASGKARNDVRRTSGLDLDHGLAEGLLDRDVMIGVMSVAVIRALTNFRRGLGVKSMQFPEETTEFDLAPDASSLVYFTPSEIADLTPLPAKGGLESSSFSISPSYAPDRRPQHFRRDFLT